MNKKYFIIAYVSVICLATGFSLRAGEEADSLLAKANELYTEQSYENAIKLYKSVIDSGYVSADLYYNLGCAYYKSHKIPEAILNLERAKLRAPNDDDINFNLELAKRQLTDNIDELPVFFIKRWMKSFIASFSTDQWAVISMAGFVLSLFLFLVYLFVTRINLRKISFWLSLFLFFIAVVSFVFSFKQKNNTLNNNQAIVMSPTVTVKSSPDESGTDLFVIHEGLKVSVEDSISNWREIRLSNGNKGWVKFKNIEKI